MKHLKQCPFETSFQDPRVFTGMTLAQQHFPSQSQEWPARERVGTRGWGGGGSGEVGAERWSLPSSAPPPASTGGSSAPSPLSMIAVPLLFIF